MRFTAAVTQEPPWYVARCLEIEVTSQGETIEEALRNLREALVLYFDDQPIPDYIETPIIAPVDIPAWVPNFLSCQAAPSCEHWPRLDSPR
jgi:predicted RNase H-like HicB family nuclease